MVMVRTNVILDWFSTFDYFLPYTSTASWKIRSTDARAITIDFFVTFTLFETSINCWTENLLEYYHEQFFNLIFLQGNV